MEHVRKIVLQILIEEFLNAILNDVPEEEIRRIQTVVVVGKHLVNHINNFRHYKMTIRTKMKTY